MSSFASVVNGVVTNLVVADTLEVAEEVSGAVCVEYTDHNAVGIGWTYDGNNFIAPEPIG